MGVVVARSTGTGPVPTGAAVLVETSKQGRDSALPQKLDIVVRDQGRLQIDAAYAELLAAEGLDTCAAWLAYRGGQVAREIGGRHTARIELDSPNGPRGFYLKRHAVPRWHEHIEPWFHLRRPVLGARHEWDAILRLQEAGLPTVTPVAMGEVEGRSFLVTAALDGYRDLREWLNGLEDLTAPRHAVTVRRLLVQLASLTARLHGAGLHHQDYYLNHLLVPSAQLENAPPAGSGFDIRIIDLGRVRHEKPLSARWIIKDLAQLNFSASRLPRSQRLRFVRMYLGRPFTPTDRSLVARICAKSRGISRHTARHAL